MTDIDEARKRLEVVTAIGGDTIASHADIRTVLDAMDAAERERDEALREMHARELHHFEEEQKSAELAAVIERALENPLRMTAGVQAVLQSAPADALRAVKAEVWDEAWRAIRGVPHWFNPDSGYGEFDLQPLGPDETSEKGALMAVREVMLANPYRETKEKTA